MKPLGDVLRNFRMEKSGRLTCITDQYYLVIFRYYLPSAVLQCEIHKNTVEAKKLGFIILESHRNKVQQVVVHWPDFSVPGVWSAQEEWSFHLRVVTKKNRSRDCVASKA